MTPRTLAMIVGSAYSGSTLLTALLDRHRDISTIGEASSLYDPQALKRGTHCWRCGCSADDCERWRQWDRDQSFYAFAFATNPGRIVVDSSKDPAKMVEQWHKAATYPKTIKAIHISKSPPEQVASYYRHQKWKTPAGQSTPWTAAECVDHWILTNYWYVGYLQQSHVPALRVTYADLTQQTDAVLDRIAAFLEIDAEWGERDSHTLGGNPAVASVQSTNAEHYDDEWRASYLDGKYAHQPDGLQVKYDESWRDIPADFAAAAAAAADERGEDVGPLLQLLGHTPRQGANDNGVNCSE